MRSNSRAMLSFACLTLVLSAFFTPSSATVRGQTAAPSTAKAVAAPAPLDMRPLGRYVPREKLAVYFEFEGIAAHEDAWKKTVASRMLNETTLGVMLEEVTAQLARQTVLRTSAGRLTDAEVATLTKSMLHAGFALGLAGGDADPAHNCAVLVLRGAARKETRAPISRLLLAGLDPTLKAAIAKKAGGRSIVVMPRPKPAPSWAWWAEKDDVVIALDKVESADVVIEVLDGKRPSVADDPLRTDLLKPDGGFTPVAIGAIDVAALVASDPKLKGSAGKIEAQGVRRIDFRWGFQDNALMSVTRLAAPKPRQGLLSLFDQPTFTPDALAPMPAGLDAFTAFSLQPAKVFDTLLAVAKAASPPVEQKVNAAVEALKTKGRVQLRKDVLARLGPKMAYYVPPESATKTAAAPASATPPGAPPNPFALMLAGVTVPKFVVVIALDDPVAFGKALDALMIEVNRAIRDQIEAKMASPAAGAEPGGAAKPGDAGDLPLEFPEFKMMPGQTKAYLFNLPSALGRLPAGFRPTLRVGPKHLAIASSPEAAKRAVDLKSSETWTASSEVTPAFEQLPKNLVALSLFDPRASLPKTLASLPAELQKTINTMILQAMPPGVGGMPAAGTPGAPGVPPGSSPPASPMPAPDSTPPPGGSAAVPAGPALIQLQVDPARLPSADTLKGLLFPATFAVAVDDRDVRFIRRGAFPNISASGPNPILMGVLGPAIQKAREAALKAALSARPPGSLPGVAAPATPGATPPGANPAPR